MFGCRESGGVEYGEMLDNVEILRPTPFPHPLAAMDQVAARHSVELSVIALAWLMQRESITALIASATSEKQLEGILSAASIRLSGEDIQLLDTASVADG